jgi:hypothetical protein
MKITRIERLFEILIFSLAPFFILPIRSLVIGWGINILLTFALVGITTLSFFPCLGIVAGTEFVLILVAIAKSI